MCSLVSVSSFKNCSAVNSLVNASHVKASDNSTLNAFVIGRLGLNDAFWVLIAAAVSDTAAAVLFTVVLILFKIRWIKKCCVNSKSTFLCFANSVAFSKF